jgi:hypothetical protein
MKSLILASSIIAVTTTLSGCVVDSYGYGGDPYYQHTETSTYIPAGSTMIYTERVTTPQFYYRETYPVYVQPRPPYRPYYNSWHERPRPPSYHGNKPHWNNGNRPNRPPMNNHGHQQNGHNNHDRDRDNDGRPNRR